MPQRIQAEAAKDCRVLGEELPSMLQSRGLRRVGRDLLLRNPVLRAYNEKRRGTSHNFGRRIAEATGSAFNRIFDRRKKRKETNTFST